MNRNRRTLAGIAAILVAASAVPIVAIVLLPPQTGLVAFQSYSELFGYLDRTLGGQVPADLRNAPAFGGGMTAGPAAPGADYSGTNVQVAGIDELDTVKTDGSYLYLAGGRDVAIVRAAPATSLAVVARIPAIVANDSVVNASTASVRGLFVVGNHLVVVASGGWSYPFYFEGPVPIRTGVAMPQYVNLGAETLVSIYDITDPTHPVLAWNTTVSGMPTTGRMIAPYVYLVLSDPVVRRNETYNLPYACIPSSCGPLPPESIYFDPTSNEASTYTGILALQVDTSGSSLMSVVTGYTSTVYMSFGSLYLTYAKWDVRPLAFASPTVPPAITSSSEWTTIHRLSVDGLRVQAVAHADVSGTLLNSYSLDESNGYLRVFTTVADWSNGTYQEDNRLTVLNPDLARVGGIAGIAPGERIYSARFLGDRAYLDTYRQVDPLFVIDVSEPTLPRILGQVNMTGYANYLHPIDAGHLLGIGKDTTNLTGNEWSWQDGLKIALFNVSDVSHPAVADSLVLGERGTDSDVLWDPKAFLPIPSLGLVVLPVSYAEVNTSQYPQPTPPWAWGPVVWQGVYVLSVDDIGGVRVVGRITQENGTAGSPPGGYLNGELEIHRSLYIGDVLYTISPSVVEASALGDLSELSSVSYEPTSP